MNKLLRTLWILTVTAISARGQAPAAPPSAPVVSNPYAPMAAKSEAKTLETGAPGNTLPPSAKPAATPTGPAVVPPPAGPVVLPEGPRPQSASPGGTVPQPSPGSGQQAGKPAKPYIIGPLDVLEVRVWNDQKLSLMVDVATDGTISMPLIGPVLANGLTTTELTAALKERLNSIIIEPEVNVQVVRINSKKYSIFGAVQRTGEFPLVGDVTILDAFANCGGFKDFANTKKIYVLRGTQTLKFNYREVIKGKHMEQNIALENGDRIVVPE